MRLPPLEASQLYGAATAIVRRLRQQGFIAYFAGGSVRDALLGKPPKDIDIATDAKPDDVGLLFRRTVAVGVQFGVIRVLEQAFEFEVATFRSDGRYTDGRHPAEVRFATPEE